MLVSCNKFIEQDIWNNIKKQTSVSFIFTESGETTGISFLVHNFCLNLCFDTIESNFNVDTSVNNNGSIQERRGHNLIIHSFLLLLPCCNWVFVALADVNGKVFLQIKLKLTSLHVYFIRIKKWCFKKYEVS